jgi:hypothetical protein
MSRVVPRFWQRYRRFTDRRRGKASLRWRRDEAAKFFPARGMRCSFLLRAQGHAAIISAPGDAEEMERS